MPPEPAPCEAHPVQPHPIVSFRVPARAMALEGIAPWRLPASHQRSARGAPATGHCARNLIGWAVARSGAHPCAARPRRAPMPCDRPCRGRVVADLDRVRSSIVSAIVSAIVDRPPHRLHRRPARAFVQRPAVHALDASRSPHTLDPDRALRRQHLAHAQGRGNGRSDRIGPSTGYPQRSCKLMQVDPCRSSRTFA